ncbi:hypothetical protein [Comamonas resistens]|uniref:hypothetical protein n=1 Tax=Comamonas resistens TaxID=3046670 RepID=UPI0039BC9E02
MTKSNYQALVIASLCIPIAGVIAESVFHLIPEELADAYVGLFLDSSIGVWEVFLGLVAVVVSVLGLVAFYGLLRLRSWAPRFAIGVSMLSWLAVCFLGPQLLSGLGSATLTLGCALYGAAMVLPFYAPEVRVLFWPEERAD